MSEQDNACRAPMHYIATARAYWLDLAAMAFVFVCVSIATGRVWRFPFDDEIATLSKIEPSSVHELIATFFSTDDIHPPFSYLLFYALRQLGFSDPGMRLCSLAMSCVALGLCQILVLNWLSWHETSERLPSPTRIVAVLIFGLMPLMVSQGDALRWYPVFAVLIALFIVLYLAPRHEPQRLWSAAALGLAASTDFSAALLVPPFLFYRHVLQRRFRSFAVASAQRAGIDGAGRFRHPALVFVSDPGGRGADNDAFRPPAPPRTQSTGDRSRRNHIGGLRCRPLQI